MVEHFRGPFKLTPTRKTRRYAYRRGALRNNKRMDISYLFLCNTCNFIKNPVKGGKPPRFIIRIGRLYVVLSMRTGYVIAEYIKRYQKAIFTGVDNNHPMCMSPEKNIRIATVFVPIPQEDATAIFTISTQVKINLEVEM